MPLCLQEPLGKLQPSRMLVNATHCWCLSWRKSCFYLHIFKASSAVPGHDMFQGGRTPNMLATLCCCVAQDKWAAQRALFRDGEQISRTVMVGVRPLDAAHRQAYPLRSLPACAPDNLTIANGGRPSFGIGKSPTMP